jgi:hypothetical protein
MDKILASCFNLAKWENNGKFKSEKQAEFLLSKFDSNSEYTAGTLGPYNSQLIWTVKTDKIGIVSITKLAYKSGKTAITFERKSETELADLIVSNKTKSEQIKAERIEVTANLINSMQSLIDAERASNAVIIELASTQPNVTADQIASLTACFEMAIGSKFKYEIAVIVEQKAELERLMAS